ncbi:peptidase family M13, partial [Porphyromonas uenonis 60-3]
LCCYLSDDFVQANFDFYSKTLSGIKEMHPRWRRAVNLLNGTLGEALGEVYVKKYFPEEAKERMKTMVSNLQSALKDRISQLKWMSDETKQKAIEKLSNFTVKIGYPDKWKDYSQLNISEDKSFVDNVRSAIQFEHDFNMSELGQPVDRSRWYMNPQEVNAYYRTSTNEICFPAGILQPPFFNINADDAVNYGAIGVVIGHEMTHGFDDQGSEFDAVGNMHNWWTEADKQNFKTSTERLAQQYSKIKVNDHLNADGHLTLGENIADQGGLLVSYLALQKQLNGKKVDKIDGFTPAQRFFIGYARIWGQNITPEEEVRLTKIDTHSLGNNRVNQALKNIDAFYEAFNVQPGDPMYIAPEERVLVW